MIVSQREYHDGLEHRPSSRLAEKSQDMLCVSTITSCHAVETL